MASTKYFRVWLIQVVGTCVLAPVLSAQRSNVPAIRIEAREVLVPVEVIAKYRGDDYDVLHLGGGDFHIFEDGREQKVARVVLERGYSPVFRDNLGFESNWAVMPKGKWSRLSDNLFGTPIPSYHYIIAYAPPPSAEGSCHQINVRVSPKDVSGNRLTIAESSPVWFKDRWHRPKTDVDRRNLLIAARSEYCNTQHSLTDALYGTKTGKRLESFALETHGAESRLLIQALDFPDESASVRTRIAIDFPSMVASQSGVPSFVIGVLGLFLTKDGLVAARFSESVDAGCPFIEGEDARICRQNIPNHYETDISVPPGDYTLRVVVDSSGELDRAEIPVSVVGYNGKELGLSGIALCRRFHQFREANQVASEQSQFVSESPTTAIPADLVAFFKIPAMPFELTPLISKGMEFTPTSDRRLKKKEPLIAYFEVYEPLLDKIGTVRVQFRMKITNAKTGQLQTDTGFRPADSFVQVGKRIVPIAEQIAVNQLAKGEYRLEIQASDSAGNKTDWRVTSFAVE